MAKLERRLPRVYISGPITKGDRQKNVNQAVDLYRFLIANGYSPLCPHLSHYAETQHGCDFEHGQWLAVDREWVLASDIVLRLPGESTGADMEVCWAKDANIPVWFTAHIGSLGTMLDRLNVWRAKTWKVKVAGDECDEALARTVRHGNALFTASEPGEQSDNQPDNQPASRNPPEALPDAVSETLPESQADQPSGRRVFFKASWDAGKSKWHAQVNDGIPMDATRDAAAEGTTQFSTGAVRSSDADREAWELLSPIGLRRVALAAGEGEIKYTAHNWERGMSVRTMLRHAIRHMYLYLAGDRSEDHLGHAGWNLLGACHSEELWPHLNEHDLRRAGCIPPNVSDEDAAQWRQPRLVP